MATYSNGNLNDIRAYPFIDTADRVADSGSKLPEFVINDLHIWWPDSYGDEAFVSAVTVSPYLVTVIIAALDDTTATQIASVQIVRPEKVHSSYAVTGLVAGVGGWLAVGAITEEYATGVHTWLFSTPNRAKLLPKLACGYPSFPVTSLGETDNANTLTGIVKFLKGKDLKITNELREIDGVTKRCVVFALSDAVSAEELYKKYSGPCGKRPESNTCDNATIRRINSVEPTCDGTIYIEVDHESLRGLLDIPEGETEAHGIALYTPIEYDDICTKFTFPATYEDECADELSSAEEEESSDEEEEGDSSSSDEIVEEEYDLTTLTGLQDWTLIDVVDIYGDEEVIYDWE